MQFDYDLFVIGAGSGGVRASRMAASYGAKVAICEDRYLGGTCVNVGCVPKKLYVYASEFSSHFEQAQGYGWQKTTPSFDWSKLRDNKKTEIQRLNGIYQGILERANVDLINGRGKIIDAHTVEVNGQQYTAERIVIAVGGDPYVPDVAGKQYIKTSNDIFDLDSLPQRIVIVGGGYIGVEFAGIFNGLGSQVSLVHLSDLFLDGFDDEIRQFAAEEMSKKGVDLLFNTTVTSIEKNTDNSVKVTLANGDQIEADEILYATGRKPRLADLGLENVAITLTESGHIKVNDHFQTSEASIYALGDATGGIALTPVALEEGMVLAKGLYQNGSWQIDYNNIATTVFSQPNIGVVGMTEQQAKSQYSNVVKYRSNFKSMKHALSGSDERTLMKMLVDADSDKVLGVHMVGADAGEIMQGIAIAIKAGATKADFDATIGIHPTAAEEFVTMREPVSD